MIFYFAIMLETQREINMLEAILIYLVIQLVVYDFNPNPAPKGYTDYDPCIRCGEDWEFYPPSNSKI